MKTPNILKKPSTLYKSERVCNPVKFKKQRQEFIGKIITRIPKFNIKVTITDKPY